MDCICCIDFQIPQLIMHKIPTVQRFLHILFALFNVCLSSGSDLFLNNL